MIQFAFQTSQGPLGIIGINHENLRRMQAGMPLDINLKAITPPGMKMNRLVIHYAKTYEDVLRDVYEGGFDIPHEMFEKAKEMDTAVREEKKASR